MIEKIFNRAGRPAGVWAAPALVLVFLLCGGWSRKHAGVDSSDSAFDQGWQAYRLGDYEKATRLFDWSERLATNEADRIRGVYAQADVWNFKSPGKDAKKAANLYRRVAAEDAAGNWAPWEALALVRQKQLDPKDIDKFPDLEMLEREYGGVMQNYPGHDAADEAFLYLQVARLVQTEDAPLKTAVEELEKWVEARKDSPYLSFGQAMLAHGYLLQGRGRKHIDALMAGVETANAQARNENLPQGDQAGNYFKIAMAAQFDAGNFELARKYYHLLMEESPTDQRVFVAEQHLAKMAAFEEEVRRELREKGE